MDLMDPGPLFSGAVISMVGMAIFLYGKRMQKIKNLGIGVLMMIFPIFVHSILLMWLMAIGCIAAMYVMPQGD